MSPAGASPGGIPAGKTFFFEGVGRRRPYFCRTAQDGHSPAEQALYDFLWKKANATARFHGARRELSGAFLVEASMSEIIQGIHGDRKQAKALLESLITKLAIEIEREPDFKRQMPTRYRVFTDSQILQRRKDAGLVYAVRNRGVKFISISVVQQLVNETPGGEEPGGTSPWPDEVPAGLQAETPGGLEPEIPAGPEHRGFLIK